MLSLVPMAGLDVGKHFIDLMFHPAAQPLRCDNAPAGRDGVIAALRRRGVLRVALEAFGPYAQPLVMALVAAGFAVALVDPRRVRAFRTAEGAIAKTDRLDAALIAMEKTRLAQALDPLVTDSHRTVIRTLEAACAEVEAALDRRSRPTRSLTASAPSSPRSRGSASASPPC